MADAAVYQQISFHWATAKDLPIGASVKSADGSYWAKLTIDKTEIVFFADSADAAAAFLSAIGCAAFDAVDAVTEHVVAAA